MLLSRSLIWCTSYLKYRYFSTCKLNKLTSVSLLTISQARTSPLYSPVLSSKLFYSKDLKEPSLKKTTVPDKPKKPKKEIKTYITLLDIDKKISVTTVEDAAKLALRRNYKLVKVTDLDPKTDRAVYQLVTESQYLKEDKGWDETKTTTDKTTTDTKVVSFSSNINEHDVVTKVNMMKKWLLKKYEVRVVITGDLKAGENVYKIIEKCIDADGRIVQKRIKGSDIRFQILPPKKSVARSSEASEKATM